MTQIPDGVDLAIVGFGAAGLSATLSALETVRESRLRDFTIAVLESAPMRDRGGNTRWSTAGIHAAPDTDAFVDSFRDRTYGAEAYVRTLSQRSKDTIAWLRRYDLVIEPGPRTFMTGQSPDLQPVGGGGGIVTALAPHVERTARGEFFGANDSLALGVAILYETTATGLVLGPDGRIEALVARDSSGREHRIKTPSVVIASGGFEGSTELMNKHIGYWVPPICRGGTYNKGDGIEMALALGAKRTGQWNAFHPLPADPRTAGAGAMTFAAVMETAPYGIVVNRDGVRFMDEGATSMNELYDGLSRSVQRQPGSIAYVVFDSSVFDIPGYQTAVAKDQIVAPYSASSVSELSEQLGVDSARFERTIAEFNAGTGDSSGFDAFRPDGLAASRVVLPKSNWARPIQKAPFYAYPVICTNVFTFGGIGTNERAEVVREDDVPIPGLYAAGEVTGLYHRDYVGTTAVLRSLVFGRIAGQEAASYALARAPVNA